MTIIDQYADFVFGLTKGSRKYHSFCFVALLSGLLEKRVWIDRGLAGKTFPNIFVILVGFPGISGKTTAINIAFNAGKLADLKLSLCSDKTTPAALLTELSNCKRTFEFEGQLIEQSFLFAKAGELASLVEDIGGGSMFSDLIVFYDAPEDTFQKNTIKSGFLLITNGGLTILGATTPDYLERDIPKSTNSYGLLSRFMFVVESGAVEKLSHPITEFEIPYEILNTMKIAASVSGPIEWSLSGQKRFDEIFREIDKKLIEYSGVIRTLRARDQTHILKLSMIFGAIDGMLIRREHVDAAFELFKTGSEGIVEAFGVRHAHRDPSLMFNVLSCIPYQPSKISESQLLTKLFKSGYAIPKGYDFKAIIDGLVAMRSIKTFVEGKDIWFTKLKGEMND